MAKTKNFQDYLEKRLDKKEIAEIEKMVQLEKQIFHSLQQDIALFIHSFMDEQDIGFNELARRLGQSPTQVVKMQRGEANLTLASIAHIFALLKKQPKIICSESKNT